MADYDIAGAFERIEDELIASLMRNFSRHRAEETERGIEWSQWQAEQLSALDEYAKHNRRKYGTEFKSINSRVSNLLKTTYTTAETAQERDILSAIEKGASVPKNVPQGISAAFFKMNESKLDALVDATTHDLEKAEHAVLRRANDQYRKIIFNAQVAANSGAMTYEQAVDMATKDFLHSGIDSIEYSNGARHTISDYSRMAIRTANKRANLIGEGQKRNESGVRTVVVNKRHNACPHCAQYVGKVFIDDVYSGGTKDDGDYPMLSDAIKNGLFHPNCKDGLSTYYPELTELDEFTDDEIEEMEQREELETKRDACANEADKLDRMSEYSLDPNNKRKYAARAEKYREREADIKEKLHALDETLTAQKPKAEKPKPSAPKAEKANGIKSVVDSWEAENYKNSTEAGLLITSDGKEIDFGGTDHHVTGKADDIKLMYGAVFTHNHPTDNTFSQNDIVTGLVKGNLKELRAVTSTGDVHILENNGASEEQRKKFSAAYQQRRIKAANAADSKIRKGERINKGEYVKSRLEAFMSEHAEDYNLTYSKAKIKPKTLEKSVDI